MIFDLGTVPTNANPFVSFRHMIELCRNRGDCFLSITIGLTRVSLNNQFGLNMAANNYCCQRMCHFDLSLPISLKPVGGITSHLGHKVILGSFIVS